MLEGKIQLVCRSIVDAGNSTVTGSAFVPEILANGLEAHNSGGVFIVVS
jgi:hypothetical protein